MINDLNTLSKEVLNLVYLTGVSSLEIDKIISKDCTCSYLYANYILKGKFELGENTINQSAYHSYYYAKYVLKARFKLGENLIQINSRYSYNYPYEYCCEVLKYNHE